MVDPASYPYFRKPGHCQSYPLTDLKTYKRGTPPLPFQFSEEPMNVADMASIMARASCDECGLLFETLSDLQNHVRNWCYAQSDRKRPRLESQSSEEEENDNHAFINMANEIKEETQERFNSKCSEIPGRWLYSEVGQRGSRDGHAPRRSTNDV